MACLSEGVFHDREAMEEREKVDALRTRPERVDIAWEDEEGNMVSMASLEGDREEGKGHHSEVGQYSEGDFRRMGREAMGRQQRHEKDKYNSRRKKAMKRGK